MILLTAMMVGLLGYQVMMPQVDNAKYTFTVYQDKIIKMNTQNGSFEICDNDFKCTPATNIKEQEYFMQVKTESNQGFGSCGCGRSPTGKCIGWHGLSEEAYKRAKDEWELNEYKRQAQNLWNDSCTIVS